MPYQVAPTPLSRLRRVKGLSTATIVMTAFTGVGAVIAAIVTPTVADRARDFLRGEITEDEFLESYGIVALAQLLQGVGTIAVAVLSIIWLYRLAANVRAMGRSTTWAPIWAVFGWLLPPLLYVIPLLMLREVWKASTSDPAANSQPNGWKSTPDNPLLWVWFLLYSVIPIVLTVLQARSLFGQLGLGGDTDAVAEALDQNVTYVWLGALATIGAAVAWIRFTKALTEQHVLLTGER